jgi:hypothetical protein
MESDRFDRLVKFLASVDTRRGLLRLLLSGPLAPDLATRREEASGQGQRGDGRRRQGAATAPSAPA